MHIEQRLRRVHLAIELVQDGTCADDVAPLVELDATEEVGEVLFHEKETAVRNIHVYISARLEWSWVTGVLASSARC